MKAEETKKTPVEKQDEAKKVSELPSIDEFMDLLKSDQPVTAASKSGYAVYHKYSRSC